MNLDGLGLTDEQTAELFAVEPKTWIDEAELTEQYYSQFGDHVPAKLNEAARSSTLPARGCPAELRVSEREK